MDKKNAVRGCLIGGAAGDALGYPVEFDSYSEILNEFGTDGITEYKRKDRSGKALISDDTQMTLFTAAGILVRDTGIALKAKEEKLGFYIGRSYKDWLKTQETDRPLEPMEQGSSWLVGVQELYSCRAPGGTCLDALRGEKLGSVKEHINHSKGCGGVMRVAPVGIRFGELADEELAMEGAETAALTHSHSLGYMPAATLTVILNRIVFHRKEYQSLKEIVLDAKAVTKRTFADDEHLQTLEALIDKAIEFSANDRTDIENINVLGQGWVAEETLAIAIYCALKYQDDFSKAIVAAVNHDGDSDSTGAVTGNMVGAWIGYDEIDEKWKKNLELSDTIIEISDDLCLSESIAKTSVGMDAQWKTKYGRDAIICF